MLFNQPELSNWRTRMPLQIWVVCGLYWGRLEQNVKMLAVRTGSTVCTFWISWVTKRKLLQRPRLPFLEMLMTIEASQKNIGRIQTSLGLKALKIFRHYYREVYKEPSPLPQSVIHRNPRQGASSLWCPWGTQVTEIPGNRMTLEWGKITWWGQSPMDFESELRPGEFNQWNWDWSPITWFQFPLISPLLSVPIIKAKMLELENTGEVF